MEIISNNSRDCLYVYVQPEDTISQIAAHTHSTAEEICSLLNQVIRISENAIDEEEEENDKQQTER